MEGGNIKATDVLRTEHRAIKRMLRILNSAAEKLSAGEKVDPSMFERGVDFVRTFADKCHHGKEEGLLFPLMEEKGFPKESGPIGQMLIEHDEGRRFIRGVSDATARYKNGDCSAVKDIVENVYGYTGLLSRHIDKEDFILFSMADRVLSEDEDEALFGKFEQVEKTEIGEGVHEAYHRMLDDFEKALNIPPGDESADSKPGCLAFVDDVDSTLDEISRETRS